MTDHGASYFFYVVGFELPNVVLISVGPRYELRTSSCSFKFMCSSICDSRSHRSAHSPRKL